MKYKLLLLDIDGTLRPGSCERVPKENAEAVCAVQKAGVKIAIATGRGRIGVGKGLLRSIRPDYWVCAGGAQLVDYKGADLALHRLTTEEMYALVDFFEDYDLPLRTSWTARIRTSIWRRCPSVRSAFSRRRWPTDFRKNTAIWG